MITKFSTIKLSYTQRYHNISGGVSASVSGGTLSSDATYYYQTFTTSGTLSILGTLVADVLVVAGGGGGGSSGGFGGGGGGAGGLRVLASQTFTSSQTVTIGGKRTRRSSNSQTCHGCRSHP